MDVILILDNKYCFNNIDNIDDNKFVIHYHCIEINVNNGKFELYKSSIYIPYDIMINNSKEDICLLYNIYNNNNNILCRNKNIYGYLLDGNFIEFSVIEQENIKSKLLELLIKEYCI